MAEYVELTLDSETSENSDVIFIQKRVKNDFLLERTLYDHSRGHLGCMTTRGALGTYDHSRRPCH